MSLRNMKRTITSFVAIFYALTLSTSLDAAESTKNIVFGHGQHSSVVTGSVVRGDRDVYVVWVKAGQVMSVKATALEHNVAFSIFEPQALKTILGTEDENDLTTWSGTLTKSGAYRIVVGGSRGNATYTLQISVK